MHPIVLKQLREGFDEGVRFADIDIVSIYLKSEGIETSRAYQQTMVINQNDFTKASRKDRVG